MVGKAKMLWSNEVKFAVFSRGRCFKEDQILKKQLRKALLFLITKLVFYAMEVLEPRKILGILI